ncbi:hypothetical protein OSB04_012107 [Centaurea solstitialis]|uniref:Uncharacterized protein n=1 Tax=Centaurea solstitialis TaxID=347529 RepID=A0AA38TIB5_9ASTR|nr:hypothetical protein OSB04_012107 [Centaurea solstitialis]
MATENGCKEGQLPFVYLGLSIGSKMNSLEGWKVLLDKFTKKLGTWKRNSLDRGTPHLIQKVNWVAWDICLNSMENGGLGIRSFRAQNVALLAKWWWQFKNEKKNALWKNIINAFPALPGASDKVGGEKRTELVWLRTDCHVTKWVRLGARIGVHHSHVKESTTIYRNCKTDAIKYVSKEVRRLSGSMQQLNGGLRS